MAGYKETPRQKMIGMMYLVLTALLALNVSKDILNAFVIVNQGLKTSQENTSNKNDLIYSNFQKAFMTNPGKVKPFLDKAYKAQNYSKEISKFISNLRTKIIAYTEFAIKDNTGDHLQQWTQADTMAVASIEAKDNYDKPMEVLKGTTEDGSNGDGKILKDKLDQFKKDMLDLLDGKDKIAAEKSFPINTGDVYSSTEKKMESWIQNNFDHTVLVADIALLNKMLIDVKTVEGDVIAKLYSNVDAGDFKFDKIVAKVVPKSNYVLIGTDYEAEIFVAAYDSKKNPDILIGSSIDTITGQVNGSDVTTLDSSSFKEGMGIYKVPSSGAGLKKYSGVIKVKAPSGEIKVYPFKSEYIVAPPSATVSADKMNVFYIGVINPVTVSVPGAANDQVHPSISAGGSMVSKGNGHYDVSVTAGCPSNKVSIGIMAEMNGKNQSMGAPVEFRVKRVPDPVAMIANQTGGLISKTVLAAAGAIIPTMKDFDFDLHFIILSFTMTINLHGDLIEVQSTNNQLTSDMVKKLQSAPTGTKVYLENIKAKGPDGSFRTLSSINLKLSN
jgi:gliding motility-associated protein GldM